MVEIFAKENYEFQIDQLYKDQNFLQEMMKYDYTCISEQISINESKLTDLVKNFFKYIIQKINDMINFIRKIFGKVKTDLGVKVKKTQERAESVKRTLSQRFEGHEIILKNEKVQEMNFISYESIIEGSSISGCKNLNIAQKILDFYIDPISNEKQIELNVPLFIKEVQVNGYNAACSSMLFSLKYANVKINDLKNNGNESGITDQNTMKKILYSSIFLDKQDKDVVDYEDIKVDSQFVFGLELDIGSIDKGTKKIANLLSLNEKTLSTSKKKIQNIENRMNGEVVTEKTFKLFKLFSDNFIKLFNYNRDILIYLSEISNFQLNYINRLMSKIEQAL